MIALLMSIALQAEPLAGVDVGNWTFLSNNARETTSLLVKPGPAPHLLWVRYEAAAGTAGFRSMRALVEADCRQGKTRTIQRSAFSQPNMQGPLMPGASTIPDEWSYPEPDTMQEAQYQFVCGS